ncbi:MAG: Lipoprotein LpqB, beta-propeller domain-like protein [Blastococcus sp.]|nr:Lipoprotein LpqB, beta-propeller domain-like protein [Blastococcus sp.]
MSRRRTGPWRLPALFVALALASSACSTVPASSPTVQITEAPVRPPEEVGIEPLSPARGATPEEIVRGFVEAAASTVAGHPIAREHLTPSAARSWSDETGITVISPDYASVTTESGRVSVTANLVGTVDQRGVFSVGGEAHFTREYTLEEVDGEWRITDPAGGLVILEPDFERLYRLRAAYFLDPTGQRVVPDPRYLITGEAQPTALVERLLDGPSSALAAGVRNPLSGAELRRTVTVDDQSAVVDLTGLSTDPAPVLSQICAQLVWTLEQLRIRTVEIRIDGQPVDIDAVPAEQTVDDWAAFDPEGMPVDAVGHYVWDGALRTVPEGEPAPGPAGTGTYGLTSAAVSADPRTGSLSFVAGVRSQNGQASLLAGPYGKELAPVLNGSTFTAPTVAGTRSEIWLVRNGTEVVRVPAGATPQAVSADSLAGLGRAVALQLSPDGVRAAAVVDGPEGPALYVGTVVRAEDGGVALRDLREVAPSLSQVADVAWQDGASLYVLAGDAAEDRIVPYLVGVDGFGLTEVPTSGLPSQPEAIGAAPARLPLVSAGGTIWQLASGTWITLVRGAEPLQGTEPFYPL